MWMSASNGVLGCGVRVGRVSCYFRPSHFLFQPFLVGDAADVFRPIVLEELVIFVFFGVMKAKATLRLSSMGLDVVGEVTTPKCFEVQVFKSVSHHFTHCFRNQAFAPVRHADPVGYFTFLLTDFKIAVATYENAHTTNSTAIFFQFDRVHLWVIEDCADDVDTVLHTGVRRPASDGADSGVFGIFV